jgi:hypothetical protein
MTGAIEEGIKSGVETRSRIRDRMTFRFCRLKNNNVRNTLNDGSSLGVLVIPLAESADDASVEVL